MKTIIRRIKNGIWDDVLIVVLAFISLFLLIIEYSISSLTVEQIILINKIDIYIAYFFLFEFIVSVWIAENKIDYVKKNWTDLLASIPLQQFAFLRPLRLLRIVRIIVVLARLRKTLNSIHIVRAANFVYAIVLLLVLIIFSGTIFFIFEFNINDKVNTFSDALYWAAVTSSTLGYGDITPITEVGKIMSVFLTFAGLGIIGAVGGLVAGTMFKEKE